MKTIVHELRIELGLSQAAFGDAIGVTRGRVSQVESGDGGNFGIPTLLRIAALYRAELARLGYETEDLMRRDKPRRPNRQKRRGAAA